MTTPPHDDQAHEPVEPFEQAYDALAAFEGLGELLDPDPQMGMRTLEQVSVLVQILTTHLRTHLDAAWEEHSTLRQALDQSRRAKEEQP